MYIQATAIPRNAWKNNPQPETAKVDEADLERVVREAVRRAMAENR